MTFSDNYLLNKLKMFNNENNRTPTQDDFSNSKNSKYPSFGLYSVRFGSWNKALEIVGLDINHYINIPENELLSKLIEFYKENNRVPTQRDFLYNSKYPNYNTYIYRFGSWNLALEKANLYINRFQNNNLSDDELLNFLLQFHKDYGLIPTVDDFNDSSKYPTYGTYRNRFGSWTNALKIINLDVDSTTKLDILDNNYQKGRQAELMIINHFKTPPADLSGANCLSHWDGICPNGMIYDVKSSKFHNYNGNRLFHFSTKNKYKEKIELYYFLGFDEDHYKLIYAWRIPSDIVNDYYLKISISPSNAKFNTDNMKKFEITDKVKEFIKKEYITTIQEVTTNKDQKSLLDF